jgi:nitrate/nitrite-specific signal transduction histidine kinase
VFYTNISRVGALLVTFIVVLFVVVFRSTHKYYGPLVSIERFVDQIAEGDYSKRVVIRRSDELQRLAARLNLMAQKLEERHGVLVERRRSASSPTEGHEES